MQYSQLIIIERVEQIEELIKYNNRQSVFLSLSPEVGLKLRKKNIRSLSVLQYFSTVDHSCLVMKSNRVMNLFRESYVVATDLLDNESYKVTSFYYLRGVVNYILLMLSVVDNIVKDIRPSRIVVPGNRNSGLFSGLEINDNLFADIIKEYCKANDSNISYSIENIENDSNENSKNYIKYLKESIFGNFLCEVQIIFFNLFYKNKKTIVGTGFEYNMNRVMDKVADMMQSPVKLYISPTKKHIRNNVIDFIKGKIYFFAYVPRRFVFRRSVLGNKYSALMSKYSDLINKNKPLLDFKGVFMGAYVLEYFKSPLQSEMKKIEYYNDFVARLLSSNNILTAFAPHNVGLNSALGVQCKKKYIPSFVVSHGTATLQVGEAMVEWEEHSRYLMGNIFPYIAVQTRSQVEFLKNRDDKTDHIVEVNPLIYANIQRYNKFKLKNELYQHNKNKIIVVHTGTPTSTRSFVPWIYETLDEYVSNINDVIEVVRNFPNVYLVVKIRPKHFHGINDIELNELFIQTDNSVISVDGDFEEYLATADLLVSYSSTTIEEALHMKVPVIQYDPFREYQHIQSQVIKDNDATTKLSPVYFVGDRKKLKKSFQWIIDNHINSQKKHEIDWSKYADQKDKDLSNMIRLTDSYCL